MVLQRKRSLIKSRGSGLIDFHRLSSFKNKDDQVKRSNVASEDLNNINLKMKKEIGLTKITEELDYP